MIIRNVYFMEGWPAPDLGQTRPSRLDGLENSRSGPDPTLDCHDIFPHGSLKFHWFKFREHRFNNIFSQCGNPYRIGRMSSS